MHYDYAEYTIVVVMYNLVSQAHDNVAGRTVVCMGPATLADAIKFHPSKYGVLKLAALDVQPTYVYSQHRRRHRRLAHHKAPLICHS